MTLGDTGMTRVALATEDIPTNRTMLDIRLCAIAIDSGGITTEDTDIMQHGCFLHKLAVDRQFLVSVDNE